MFYYSLLAMECKLISAKYATLDMLCLREHTSWNLFPQKIYIYLFWEGPDEIFQSLFSCGRLCLVPVTYV